MDGYRWERFTGEDYDYVEISEIWDHEPHIAAGVVAVPVERFGEFAAWVQMIAADEEGA